MWSEMKEGKVAMNGKSSKVKQAIAAAKKHFMAACLTVMCLSGFFCIPTRAADVQPWIDYMNGMVGKTWEPGMCLGFVATCYNNVFGISSSDACAVCYGNHFVDSESRDNIPVGADVFFWGGSVTHNGHACGHIGVYIGNNQIIHSIKMKSTDARASIRIDTIDTLGRWGYPYRGWGWHANVELTSGPVSANPDDYPFPTRDIYLISSTMRGDDVKWVQSVLCYLGYTVDIDGMFGYGCEAQLRNFQRDYGLEQDGKCGPATRAKLKEVYESKKHVHNYVRTVTKAATCTQKGTASYTCSGCGSVSRTEEIPARGHSWNAGVITTAPTETANGVKTFTCTVCRGTRTEVVKATGTSSGSQGSQTPSQPVTPQPAPSQPVTPQPVPQTPSQPVAPQPAPTGTGVASLAVGTTFNNAAAGGVYQVNSVWNTVEYKKPLNKKKKTVVIPATITQNGVTYRVTSIAANAFKNNKKLVKVKLGSQIVSIGKSAFQGCSKLKSVTLGTNVASVGAKAFYKCTALTSITLPASTETIGKQAFYGCRKLKSIKVKTTKLTSKSVGSSALKGIPAKAKIKVPGSKVKEYKKLFRGKGAGKRVSIKK